MANSGHIPVILDRVDTIPSLIPKNLHIPLSIHQDSPLHISPYNLVSDMPRSATKPKPASIKCGRHSKFGTLFGLSLPDLIPYHTTYCKLVPHYIHTKLLYMGEQYLIPRVLTSNAIMEVSQYEFDVSLLTVSPKHVRLTSPEEDIRSI